MIGSGGIYAYTDESLADENAIVVGRKGTAGRVIFPQRPSWPSDTTFFLEPDTSSISPAFLALYLQHANLSSDSTKTTMPSLQAQQLTELQVNLPDIQEQRRIARILSTIDQAKQSRQRVLVAARQTRDAMLNLLLSDMTPAVSAGRSETSGGRCRVVEGPQGVGDRMTPQAMRRLRDLAEHVRESTSPMSEDTRRYVGLEHLVSGDPSIAGWASASSVRSSKFVFRPGDTLYGKLRPYLDKAVMADFDGVASTDLLVLRPREGVDPRFLTYTMHSRSVIEHAIATTVGVNHPRTSWSSLGELEVYAPPLDEQRRIAWRLSTIQRFSEAVLREVEALDKVFHATMKSLLEPTP